MWKVAIYIFRRLLNKHTIPVFIVIIACIWLMNRFYNIGLNRQRNKYEQELIERKRWEDLYKSEKQENDSLETLIISQKPNEIIIIQGDTTLNIIIKKLSIPIESNYTLKIDLSGRVTYEYRKWGLCFRPQIALHYKPKYEFNFCLGSRVIYGNEFGFNFGAGIYPEQYVYAGITYRLIKFKLSNCDFESLICWDGEKFCGRIGLGVYLW